MTLQRFLRATVVIAFAILLAAPGTDAQVRVLNLFEFQAGNTPYASPKDQTTGYDQLNVSYAAGSFAGAVRVEQFLSQAEPQNYQQLSQYRASYKDKGAEVTVGHFYDIIGRGLLLRAYDIPGVIFEDPATRVRQGFYRDVYGFRAGYKTRRFFIKALRGLPLLNVLPPTIEQSQRRPDLVEAVEGSVNLGPASIGSAFLRNNAAGSSKNFAMVNVSANLPLGISGYAEFAQEVGDGNPLLGLSESNSHAFYGNLNYSIGALGVSAEYKDYNRFFLGSGFNDPPSLVKEHPIAVLNRSTHVLNVNNEHGFQLEAFYRLDGGTLITVNMTQAVNSFSSRFTFREYFVGASIPVNPKTSAKLFVDFAEDEFRFEENRISFGGYAERHLPNHWSASIDLEAQTFTRTIGDAVDISNVVLGVAVSNSTKLTAGLVAERSTDPFLTDDPRTIEIETDARHWLGTTFGYRPNRNHSLALFTGLRRGGPACTSGICYEVLDFRGAELRITTRF